MNCWPSYTRIASRKKKQGETDANADELFGGEATWAVSCFVLPAGLLNRGKLLKDLTE